MNILFLIDFIDITRKTLHPAFYFGLIGYLAGNLWIIGSTTAHDTTNQSCQYIPLLGRVTSRFLSINKRESIHYARRQPTNCRNLPRSERPPKAHTTTIRASWFPIQAGLV